MIKGSPPVMIWCSPCVPLSIDLCHRKPPRVHITWLCWCFFAAYLLLARLQFHAFKFHLVRSFSRRCHILSITKPWGGVHGPHVRCVAPPTTTTTSSQHQLCKEIAGEGSCEPSAINTSAANGRADRLDLHKHCCMHYNNRKWARRDPL